MTHPLTDEFIAELWPDNDTIEGREEIRRQFDVLMAQIRNTSFKPFSLFPDAMAGVVAEKMRTLPDRLNGLKAALNGIPPHLRNYQWTADTRPHFGDRTVRVEPTNNIVGDNGHGLGRQWIARVNHVSKQYVGTLADFIAAANPDTVAMMIARIEELEAALSAHGQDVTRCSDCDGYNCDDGCAYPDARPSPSAPLNVLEQIKLIALTCGAPKYLSVPNALRKIIKLCNEAGVEKKLDELRTTDTPRQVGVTALRDACQKMADDFQTSAIHHPDYVLVSLSGFDAMKYALDFPEMAPHPDDVAVNNFAMAMSAKMTISRVQKGRGGWEDKQQCTQQELSIALVNHMRKGDPVDVANFAMMLHQRGERIDLPPMSINIDLADADKVRLIEKLQAGTRHLEFLASNIVAKELIEEDPAPSDVAHVIEESGGWWHSKPTGELCDVCSEIAKIDARMVEINKILDEPRADWMRPLEDEFTFHRGQLQVLKSLSAVERPAPTVAVKALEWHRRITSWGHLLVAYDPFSRQAYGIRVEDTTTEEDISKAKAEKQADYEARIRSALSTQVRDVATAREFADRMFKLSGFMLSEDYRGKPAVTITFPDNAERNQFYSAIVDLSKHKTPAAPAAELEGKP